mmetsp:Transcript_97620/g.273124  ORF Transcript_97620/g.273124 Transcript_97620/m.273124 type:complete len:207 (-) Transcript_97620:261-881(-)
MFFLGRPAREDIRRRADQLLWLRRVLDRQDRPSLDPGALPRNLVDPRLGGDKQDRYRRAFPRGARDRGRQHGHREHHGERRARVDALPLGLHLGRDCRHHLQRRGEVGRLLVIQVGEAHRAHETTRGCAHHRPALGQLHRPAHRNEAAAGTGRVVRQREQGSLRRHDRRDHVAGCQHHSAGGAVVPTPRAGELHDLRGASVGQVFD